MSRRRACALAAVLVLVAHPAMAAESEEASDPATPRPMTQFDFGLRGVTSLNGVKAYGGGNAIGVIDFSDTLIYARARTPLLRSEGRAGTLVALTFPDAYYEPGTIFLAEANAFYEERFFTFRIGRGRMDSRVIPFPSLRDDDFIRWSDAQNPFSDGRSSADHQFGNTVDLTLWPSPRVFGELHVENLPTFVLRPDALAAFTVNSYGATIGYREVPALAPMAIVRQLGAAVNTYRLDLPTQDVTFDIVAGGWLNVVADPIHNVDWRLQAIYTRGVPRLPVVTINDSFRAEQMSALSSLGYAYRRNMLPTLRTNVVGGYKRYVTSKIDQFSVGYNFFYSLGVNADVGIQYQIRNRTVVPEAFGDDFAHSIKLAFIVALETSTSPIFDERDSLLNAEAGYLP